ncbi:MFS transporter [Rhizobium grahamii]|uniref:MFS transporter n=1 Tax=Rhizobium grahamii TaxID=1120045 RepID=A0A370KF74_9HYPH|nr:MFS transporter [Rhizobium grahamii]RDJ02984.1 MFS transporter [Rhizobium grahamii]
MNVKPEASAFEVESRTRDAHWPGVVSLGLGVFGLVTAEFLPASLLTPISHDLGISIGAAGQSVTMTAVIGAIAGPAVVIATSRLDRRLTLWGLTTLLIISSFLAAVAGGLATLLVARAVLGIALGGFWAMSLALAMRLVPEELMPRAMAVIMTGVSVATVCAAPVGAWVGETLGWRAAFLIAATVGAIALAVQVFALPPMPSMGGAGLGTIAGVLRRPAIRIGLATILLVVSGHFAGFTFIRPFLETVPHFGVQGISGVLLAFGIGGFLGNFIGGYLAERNTGRAIAFAATGIAATTLALAIVGAHPTIAFIATALWGFAFGALPVSVQSFVTQAASDEAESAGALMLTTFQIAISSGAAIGGLIVETQGLEGVFGFAAIAALCGSALIGVLGRSTVRAIS